MMKELYHFKDSDEFELHMEYNTAEAANS